MVFPLSPPTVSFCFFSYLPNLNWLLEYVFRFFFALFSFQAARSPPGWLCSVSWKAWLRGHKGVPQILSMFAISICVRGNKEIRWKRLWSGVVVCTSPSATFELRKSRNCKEPFCKTWNCSSTPSFSLLAEFKMLSLSKDKKPNGSMLPSGHCEDFFIFLKISTLAFSQYLLF